MRDIKVIESEIAKLQAELEDVKAHESKVKAAVHILENLGWTWTRRYGWKKPTEPSVSVKEFDDSTMCPFKMGDYCLYGRGTHLEGFAVVRKVDGTKVLLSYVTKVEGNVIHASHLKFAAHYKMCEPVSGSTVRNILSESKIR